MKGLLADNEGSITLEATIAFPVFLGLVLLLINVINVAAHYVAMDHAVDESVKLIAAGSYPLCYLNAGVNTSNSKAVETVQKLASSQATINTDSGKQAAAAWGSDLFTKIAGEWLKRGTGSALEPVIRQIVTHKIREMYPLGSLNPEDFEITEIKVFNPNNTTKSNGSVNGIPLNNEDIALVVRYRVRITVPFFPLKELVLSNCAVERAWVDD